MYPFQRNEHRHGKGHTTTRRSFPVFGKDRNRVTRGHKAALPNRITARRGKKNAKQEHRLMGKHGGGETHLPFMTKVKRALGMQSTPSKKRQPKNKQKRRSALI
ncbi:hypothetical protein M405DRAFT_881966 [Rhizopogon salebrosus TDB-379]|nr:hypothetical protein M405DRAFT_881966 [Rhizopogon salebrosus TDB-379]